jgi:hypothetical protein
MSFENMSWMKLYSIEVVVYVFKIKIITLVYD